MKDPTRFLELTAFTPDAATELLRAGAVEEPPSGALDRLLGTLSLGPVSTDGTAEAHLSGVRPALRAGTGTASAGTASVKLGVRWLFVAGGGVSLLAAAWLATQSNAPTPRPAAPVQQAPQPTAAVRVTQPAITPPAAAPAEDEVAHKERRPRSLAQEIASLDQVRQLLAKGQAGQALGALRRHARLYADGALSQEASLLRIEALLRAGEPAHARVLAARFLKEHPDSPHQERVRAFVSQADASP